MWLPGPRDDRVAFPEVLLFFADRKASRALQDVVDLVRVLVGVDLLGLARQETVRVIEEPFGVEEAVFLQLLLRECCTESVMRLASTGGLLFSF